MEILARVASDTGTKTATSPHSATHARTSTTQNRGNNEVNYQTNFKTFKSSDSKSFNSHSPTKPKRNKNHSFFQLGKKYPVCGVPIGKNISSLRCPQLEIFPNLGLSFIWCPSVDLDKYNIKPCLSAVRTFYYCNL